MAPDIVQDRYFLFPDNVIGKTNVVLLFDFDHKVMNPLGRIACTKCHHMVSPPLGGHECQFKTSFPHPEAHLHIAAQIHYVAVKAVRGLYVNVPHDHVAEAESAGPEFAMHPAAGSIGLVRIDEWSMKNLY